jgi:3-hydroxyisobutyrate dehydrogenase
MTRVGFAGIGRMGGPMAANLAGAGFRVELWNRSSDKAALLAAEIGAAVRETPRDLAEHADVVVTMLADDVASAAVHSGPDGLFAASGGASHVIEMGTHSPDHVRQIAAEAGERVVFDAPVSGSIDAAREARLMIMVGASDDEVEPVRSVLAAMGREIICFGHTGAGATMKLAVNLLIHGLNQTLAEALTLAEAAGIDPATAYRAMEQSAAAAPMLHYRKPQYLDESANPVSFALSLARKDVALALDLADELRVPMPQTRVNLDQLQDAEAHGFGDRDMASMVDYLRGAR